MIAHCRLIKVQAVDELFAFESLSNESADLMLPLVRVMTLAASGLIFSALFARAISASIFVVIIARGRAKPRHRGPSP